MQMMRFESLPQYYSWFVWANTLREVIPEERATRGKCGRTYVGDDSRTDRVIHLFVLSDLHGSDRARMELR